jgi:E3 ubiquitin-protein ligase BRE1
LALEESLSCFDDDHPEIRQHVTAEAEARQQLAGVTKQLEKYQSVYGDSSTLPPDAQQLSDQLRKKEDEMQKLRLSDIQRGEVCCQFIYFYSLGVWLCAEMTLSL